MAVLASLPASDLRLKVEVPVRIRRRGNKFVADCSQTVPVLLRAEGRIRNSAIRNLGHGLVLQYNLVRRPPRTQDALAKWQRALRNALRKFIREIPT